MRPVVQRLNEQDNVTARAAEAGEAAKAAYLSYEQTQRLRESLAADGRRNEAAMAEVLNALQEVRTSVGVLQRATPKPEAGTRTTDRFRRIVPDGWRAGGLADGLGRSYDVTGRPASR